MTEHTGTTRALARIALGLSVSALALWGAPVAAQSAGPDPVDPAAAAAEEGAAPVSSADIVVTGSRIRGVAPVGSAVVAVSAGDIRKTTASNITDVLKQVPQVFTTGITDAAYQATSGSGGSNLTRGAAINLRGINPSATLTLIDGQRITMSGVSAGFVDPSVIPTFAVQRIEIVPDGASAIYGSDAIAGVANVILKKSVEGFEPQYRFTTADGYSKHQAGLLMGHDWGSGRIVVAGEYSTNTALETTERSYLYQDQRAFGGHDYRASTCNPGTITLSGVNYAIPAGNPTTGAGLVAGTSNLCDVGYAVVAPKSNRFNAYASIEQQVTGGLKLGLEGYYNRRDMTSQFGAQGTTLTSYVNLTVPKSNAFFISPTGTAPASETVAYSYFEQRGPIPAAGKFETFGLFGKANLKLPGQWAAELSATHSKNDEILYSRAINSSAQTAALASSNPLTALDVFGNRTTQATMDAIWSGLFIPEGHSKLTTAALRLDGPLADLPGGAIKLAVGAEYQAADLVFGTTRGTVAVPSFTSREAHRKVKSVYGELFIPIFSDENAVPGFRKLALSVAGRYDHYSDFGNTTNPKVGLTWKPVDALDLHASYGTSFRAPGLEQMISNTIGIQVVNAVDPLASSGRSSGLAIRDINRNLGPETARTWSFGATFAPASVPALTLSANYFSINYRGQIFGLEAADALASEGIYGSLVKRNPTPAEINAVLNMGLPLLATLPPTVSFIVDGRPSNRGVTKTSGLDFSASYAIDTGDAGKLGLSVNGLYFFNYKFQVSPIAPLVDRLNTIYNPLRFRMRGGVDWEKGGFDANLWVNYANAYDNNTVTPIQRVSAWTTFDAHLGYKFEGGAMDGLSLAVDASNIFNKRPPYVDVVSGFDAQEASVFGRTLTFSVRKKF